MGLGTSELALTGPVSGALALWRSDAPTLSVQCPWLLHLAQAWRWGEDVMVGGTRDGRQGLLAKGACACGWRQQAGGTALAVGSSDRGRTPEPDAERRYVPQVL